MVVSIIDQRWLPHRFEQVDLHTTQDFAMAIRDMWVRGAPLIGATAAWGMAKAVADDASDKHMDTTWDVLHQTRPTAINLKWALDRMRNYLRPLPVEQRSSAATALAIEIADEDVEINLATVAIPPDSSAVNNPAFDVTPARLVTGLITERGIAKASEQSLAEMFPDLQVADSA